MVSKAARYTVEAASEKQRLLHNRFAYMQTLEDGRRPIGKLAYGVFADAGYLKRSPGVTLATAGHAHGLDCMAAIQIAGLLDIELQRTAIT